MKDEKVNRTKDAMDASVPTHEMVKNEKFHEVFDSPSTSILITDAVEDDEYDHDDDQDDCEDQGDGHDDGEDENKDMTESHKKMKRILANRGSARASYQRRKKMIAELQANVTNQSIRNAAMEAENKLLRDEVHELRLQVRELLLRQMSHRHPSVGRLETSLVGALGMGLTGSCSPVPHNLLAQPHPSFAELMCLLSKKNNLAGLLRGLPPQNSGIH